LDLVEIGLDMVFSETKVCLGESFMTVSSVILLPSGTASGLEGTCAPYSMPMAVSYMIVPVDDSWYPAYMLPW
jgi:hypothetical protein